MRRKVDLDKPMGEHQKRVTAKYKDDSVQIILPLPNGKHLDRFLNRKCSLDLLDPKFELKWNSKEITESEAMLYAIRTHLKVDPTNEDVVVHVVGEGFRPRTGALLAFATRWTVFSIDPNLSEWRKRNRSSIKRLFCVDKRVEDFDGSDFLVMGDDDLTQIVMAPHSHANLAKSLSMFKGFGRKHMVARSCGDLDFDLNPSKVYLDWACLSPERLIKVWKDLTMKKIKKVGLERQVVEVYGAETIAED